MDYLGCNRRRASYLIFDSAWTRAGYIKIFKHDVLSFMATLPPFRGVSLVCFSYPICPTCFQLFCGSRAPPSVLRFHIAQSSRLPLELMTQLLGHVPKAILKEIFWYTSGTFIGKMVVPLGWYPQSSIPYTPSIVSIYWVYPVFKRSLEFFRHKWHL